MTTKRFTKGQTVYYATADFAAVGRGDREHGFADVYLGVVIERQVDACGAKNITFFDRGGNDSTFGRRHFASSPFICASADEAFAFLRASQRVDVICPDVYTDADKRCFDELRGGTMRIAEKA